MTAKKKHGDIVEDLRSLAEIIICQSTPIYTVDTILAAAEEIERLRNEIARLRPALKFAVSIIVDQVGVDEIEDVDLYETAFGIYNTRTGDDGSLGDPTDNDMLEAFFVAVDQHLKGSTDG